jgi:hypothetical protein
MERNPEYDYVETHRDTLVGLLEAGEELPLFHQPEVIIEIQGDQVMDLQYDGRQLEEYPEDTTEGVHAEGLLKEARLQTITFKAILHMKYLSSGLVDAKQSLRDEGIAEAELNDRINVDAVAHPLEATFDNAVISASGTHMINMNTGTEYNLLVQKATDDEGNVLGRGLLITVIEEGLEKQLSVTESLDRNPSGLDVKQTIKPSYDEDIMEISEFFVGQHDDQKSLATVVIHLFLETLKNDTSLEDHSYPDLLQDIFEKYTGAEDRQKIAHFIEVIKSKAEAHKSMREFQAMFPGTELPSYDELDQYKQLLDAIRS